MFWILIKTDGGLVVKCKNVAGCGAQLIKRVLQMYVCLMQNTVGQWTHVQDFRKYIYRI